MTALGQVWYIHQFWVIAGVPTEVCRDLPVSPCKLPGPFFPRPLSCRPSIPADIIFAPQGLPVDFNHSLGLSSLNCTPRCNFCGDYYIANFNSWLGPWWALFHKSPSIRLVSQTNLAELAINNGGVREYWAKSLCHGSTISEDPQLFKLCYAILACVI